MQPKVSIVILNYNTRHFLEKFLPGVMSTDYENFEVIVVDNASKDDSVSFLKNNYSFIRIIEFNENYGFAGGYNKALALIESDYYVLLNSDVEVPQNWLKPLVKLALTDQNIAAIQPKLIDYKNHSKFEYAGASGGFIDKFGYPFCRGRWFNCIEEDTNQYDDEREIFWATGACFFINTNKWKEAKGLDEDFFAHMEEIDLCWRLQNLGYSIMVCPQSIVYHVGGGTLPVGNPRKTYLNFRNGLFLLCKNLHPSILFKVLFIRFILDGLAGIKFLSEFKFKEIFAILKAHAVFYSQIVYWLNKRKQIPKQALKPKNMYHKSMVFDYYLRKKRYFSQTGL